MNFFVAFAAWLGFSLFLIDTGWWAYFGLAVGCVGVWWLW